MKFDKKYWYFIIAAVVFSSIASITTLWTLSNNNGIECDPYAITLFDMIGMELTMVLGIFGMIIIMVAIPYILKQNEKIGLASSLFLSAFVVFTFFDALNNISVIFNFYPTFIISHTAVNTVISATGVTPVC